MRRGARCDHRGIKAPRLPNPLDISLPFFSAVASAIVRGFSGMFSTILRNPEAILCVVGEQNVSTPTRITLFRGSA